ncbi:MAG TPA: dihydroorotase [Porphyromonadaceae bacterium]|jgi:dihydroorotase|nr:dihydroorotase [Porphyromonadaceae bacterium]HBX19743.1 dihydroorotase [Porphyromonadaceae bacterium]
MILIDKAFIINENKSYVGSILIDGERIKAIYRQDVPIEVRQQSEVIDAGGFYLMPGVIDDQVHFRDPGFTYKGDLFTESRAAVAGGVTSFMDMPNTNPQTVTIDALERKFEAAATKSVANYSFYMGATNENVKQLLKTDPKKVCGVKVFMGSSTGNMLVDDERSLAQIFAEVDMLIAVHCEKEEIIRDNLNRYKKEYGEDDIPIEYHPFIRSAEACYRSSAQAVELADKYHARLHVLHLSTAREMSLFSTAPLKDKKITAEACVHHLWFTDKDYARLGARIKWNPAVKKEEDRNALRDALRSRKLDVVATDHAPHLLSEKQGGCLKAASGGPLVQHSLQVMLEMAHQGVFSLEFIVEKMCHAPARLFKIKDRGFIREGYFADLVLINPSKPYTVSKDNLLYKCGWSPFEGQTFSHTVEKTFVNGAIVFADGQVKDSVRGLPLQFER